MIESIVVYGIGMAVAAVAALFASLFLRRWASAALLFAACYGGLSLVALITAKILEGVKV